MWNRTRLNKKQVTICARNIEVTWKFFRQMCGSSIPPKPAAPKPTKCDLIGPPNPISNLRPILFHIPKHEYPIETEFRVCRQEVQKWNEKFWSTHNESFIQERQEFIAATLPAGKSPGAEKQALTADEMSVFYKKFLDKNWNVHLRYNIEWYQKNFRLVILAFRVKLFKAKKLFLSKS